MSEQEQEILCEEISRLRDQLDAKQRRLNELRDAKLAEVHARNEKRKRDHYIVKIEATLEVTAFDLIDEYDTVEDYNEEYFLRHGNDEFLDALPPTLFDWDVKSVTVVPDTIKDRKRE